MKIMVIKLISIILSVAMCCGMLASCCGDSPEETPKAEGTSTEVEFVE